MLSSKIVDFSDGIVEFDVAFKQEGKGFFGIVWHFQDDLNHEHFYIRTHRSGDPKSIQYTPVINGSNAHVLYRAASENDKDRAGYYGKINFTYDTWTHIKCVMSGDLAEVYVEDMEKPLLYFPHKFDGRKGQIGLISGGSDKPFVNGAYYANFNLTAKSNPPLKVKQKPEVPPKGTIQSWSISERISNKSLDSKFRLTEKDRKMKWTELGIESLGFANLAKVQSPGALKEEKSTAFARTAIVSEKEQIKKLSFKYNLQTRVKVYFNGRLFFSAEDETLNADQVGIFRNLYLPLRKGANEIWFAMTDTDLNGGWGIEARVEDRKGITEITTAKKIDFNTQVDASNPCIATYSWDGQLHVPCLSVPVSDDPNTTVFYEADMQQQTQPPFFLFGLYDLKPR